MSIQVSAGSDTNRRSANFHPSVWGDRFLAYASISVQRDAHEEQQLQQLKEEVRRLMSTPDDKPTQKLHLIDAIQRLGMTYHFENEIDKELKYIHDMYDQYNQEDIDGDVEDFYSIALRFRLLRQQGYNVSCGKYPFMVSLKISYNRGYTSP